MKKFIEIGKSGVKWSSRAIHEEFLPQLREKTGIKMYREMSDNDPIIGACLFAIKQILREARWSVRVPEGGREEDGVFLQECMTHMSHSWNDMMTEIFSMFVYGWSYHEVVYRRRSDGRIEWKKIARRLQGSYDGWDMDDNGTVKGLWQRPAPDFHVYYIPLAKSLLFRTELAGDNPMGRSILRSAYRAYYFKKNLEEIEGIGVERDLAGIPVLTPPEEFDFDSESTEVTTALTWAKQLLANIRRDEQDGILLPNGWTFELVASPGKRQFDTTEIINRYSKEIAVTVLAQFVMLGMERTGSYALAKEQTDMFHLCLEGWLDSIGSVLNRFGVKKLFALNGVVGRPLPYFVHTSVRHFNLKDLATYVNQLVGCDALVVDEDLQQYMRGFARLHEFREARN